MKENRKLIIGYIGNGKSTNRYHIPYVLTRQNTIHIKTIYRRDPAHDHWKKVDGVHYTSNLDELLCDPEIDLVCVCTSSMHYEFAKLALEHGKHCLVEKPFTNTLAQAQELYALAERKGLLIEAYQNRRYDSDFLTFQKVLSSGKLGPLYEVELCFDYDRPEVPQSIEKFDAYQSMLYQHACHNLDQALSLFGTPDHVHTETKQLLGAGRMNDYFSCSLYYSTLKVSVNGSYYRLKPRPSIVAYGQNGMFLKRSWDRQEECLKLFYMPGQPGFGEDKLEDYGVLTWRENGIIREERVPTVPGDYARVYDALYEAILHGAPQFVTKEQLLTQMKILEEGIKGLK